MRLVIDNPAESTKLVKAATRLPPVCCNAHMCTKRTRHKSALCAEHRRRKGANSYRAEMCVGGVWSTNALRFATYLGAATHAKDLFMRWTQPSDWRVVSCDDAPTLDASTVVACEVALACDYWGRAVQRMTKRRRKAPRYVHDYNPGV